MKNYYTILEITDLASQEDVKKSYRRLVCKYHPDKTHSDINFDEQIRDINEAYSVLGNPDKRRLYDKEVKRVQNEEEQININRKSAFEDEIPDFFSAINDFFFGFDDFFESPFERRNTRTSHTKRRVTDIESGKDYYI